MTKNKKQSKPTTNRLADLVNEEIKKEMIELKENCQLHQVLIDNMPFGLQIVDMKGQVLYLGGKFMTNLEKKMVGKKCWELYKDDKKQCQDCPLKSKLKIGETKIIKVSGTFNKKIALITCVVIEYKGQKAVLEIFQDITELKRAEGEVGEKVKELERFKNVTVNRELRMKEIMAENEKLKVEEG